MPAYPRLLFWLILLISVLPHALMAQAPSHEYRAITLVDGATYRGRVVASDADNITLETLKGQQVISLFDIVQLDTITREQMLIDEGRRMVFLGVEAAPGLSALAQQLEPLIWNALQRDNLLLVHSSSLDATRTDALKRCVDTDCRLEALRAEHSSLVYAALEGGAAPHRLTLRRLDRTLRQVQEISLTITDVQSDRARIERSVALALGENPPPLPPVVLPPPVEQAAPSRSSLDLARARRLDLLPVPGASSLFVFKDPTRAYMAAGAVVGLTGLTIYLVGDMSRLGMQEGLPVGWTYPDRGIKDGLLLTGAGVAGYLLTTLAVNQVVRVIQVRSGRAPARR